jgi:hypothetical protein
MRGRRPLFTAAVSLAGVGLFAYAVRSAGVDEILDGVRRVGWGLAAVLGLAGVRFLLRAQSWRLCMSAQARLGFRHAFAAFLAGDAIGSVTPLGLLASEPSKVFLTRHRLATRESVSSLALENVIYAASVLAMVAAGLIVLLALAPLPPLSRAALASALVALAAGALVAWRLMQGTWDEGRGERPGWRARLSDLRRSVMVAPAGQGRQLLQVFGLDAAFHALAVLEVYVTLRWLMGDAGPTLAQAVVFEALNRVITVVFKFVPFRVGVDEALSGALAPLIAVSPVAGVTLAVVRKVRNLFWAGAGLAVVAAHPASATARARAASAADPPGSASARRP